MKNLFLLFIVTSSLSAFAQIERSTSVREGGGLPRIPDSVAAKFQCEIEYNQQKNSYFKLVANKTFMTSAGKGLASKPLIIQIKDLNWVAKIDQENVFAKEGKSAILDGGYLSMQVVRLDKAPLRIQFSTSTPTVTIDGIGENLIYSNETKYSDIVVKTGLISSRAQFVFSHKDGESYVVSLKATCKVTAL